MCVCECVWLRYIVGRVGDWAYESEGVRRRGGGGDVRRGQTLPAADDEHAEREWNLEDVHGVLVREPQAHDQCPCAGDASV